MTAAQALSHRTLQRIQKRFGMQEVCAGGDQPYITLQSPAVGDVGAVRIFKGEAVSKMVYIGMSVRQFGLDSHMIFAFTPADSPVPHFTLDSVMAEPDFAFHLDLLPRLDLGANIDYIWQAFSPLDPLYEEASHIEGLRPARLTPTQYAIMSPWMLAYRADERAFQAIQGTVDAYLEHWFSLVDNGLTDFAAAPDLAQRDQANRDAIFNPKVDKVWAQVERLLGAEMGERMRAILRNQATEA